MRRCSKCGLDEAPDRVSPCSKSAEGYGHWDAWVTRPDDPLCNLCGLTLVLGHPQSPATGPCGLIDAQVIGGYESTPGNGDGALDDMTRYTFSLCEFCLDWLWERFQVPVKTDDPMRDYRLRQGETLEEGLERMGLVSLSDDDTPRPAWRPATQRVTEDEWRKGRDEFYAERDRRAAARDAKR